MFDSHPVNEEQKSVIEKINNEIITQKNRKIICIVLLVGVLFLGAPVIINLIMSILHSFTVSLFVTAVGYICFAILQIKKISAIDADVNGKKLYIKNYNENLRKKRMAVADIVKNHSLSCDERIAAIQRTIES
ncbi:hypothetical protein [Ruminococcus sp. HUN007]|uniref:hypothetical protein n=1 Tax=Ruminococcus sp. HUN007 TaxID=1514668 RepID=UPI0005D1C8BD|nr:hypothetical protein [Ruminococcus sp. HUN007]